MNPPELTPQMLGSLANHLYQEGMAAYQQDNLAEAMIWYTQCLDVLSQLGGNEEMISAVLYYVGMVYGLAGKHTQALGFFEAVANIQQRQKIEESTADCLQMAGEAIAAIEYFGIAKQVLKKAMEMYRTLHLREKYDQTRQKMNELNTEGKADLSSLVRNRNRPLKFLIRIGEEPVRRLIVELNGTVKWEKSEGMEQQVAIGRIHPWNVICIKSLHHE